MNELSKIGITPNSEANQQALNKEALNQKIKDLEEKNSPLIQRINESKKFIKILERELRIRNILKVILYIFPMAHVNNEKAIFKVETEIMAKHAFILNLLEMIRES